MAIRRLMSLAYTVLKSNFTRLDKPYKLNFAVTYRCQSRCKTCSIWKLSPKNELSIEEIREFAKNNRYFKWIELTGGEVFLRDDLVDIARAFNETSELYMLTMPTNSLTNHDKVIEKIEKILEARVPKVAITVSLDGYEELHDSIRGIPGNYKKAIDMYKRLMELREKHKNLYFTFGYTMSSYNIGKFEETVKAVKKDIPSIRYNDFHINLAQVSENYYGNKASESEMKADIRIARNEIENAVRNRKMEFGAIPLIEKAFLKGLIKYLDTGKPPVRPRSLEASIFLDSFGNVYPSIMLNNKLGNIRETGYRLDSILNGSKAAEARNEIAKGIGANDWTSCEAYQSIMGDAKKLLKI